MSTQYPVYKEGDSLLEVDERSSRFDLNGAVKVTGGDYQLTWTSGVASMTAEELVEVAVKMIQPTLYNVEDPRKFFDEVIMKKVQGLFV